MTDTFICKLFLYHYYYSLKCAKNAGFWLQILVNFRGAIPRTSMSGEVTPGPCLPRRPFSPPLFKPQRRLWCRLSIIQQAQSDNTYQWRRGAPSNKTRNRGLRVRFCWWRPQSGSLRLSILEVNLIQRNETKLWFHRQPVTNELQQLFWQFWPIRPRTCSLFFHALLTSTANDSFRHLTRYYQ